MDKEIEAVLFYKNEPIGVKELGKILGKTESEIKSGIEELKKRLEDRGVALVESGETYIMATSPQFSEIINKIAREEISGEISKASLETLSIILYKSPISRREIDYIRGVNSNFTLRSLSLRGLVEKTQDKDGRVFLYQPTIALLSHLGVSSTKQLPEFDKIQAEIKAIKEDQDNE